MPYFVYILECNNKTLYTKITNNLERRLKEHQAGKGGHYTSYNPGIKIRYFEEHQTRSKAAKREAQIKGWSRTKKLALIKGDKIALKAAAEMQILYLCRLKPSIFCRPTCINELAMLYFPAV